MFSCKDGRLVSFHFEGSKEGRFWKYLERSRPDQSVDLDIPWEKKVGQ